MAITNIEKLITLDVYNHDTTPTTIKAIACDNDTRYVAAEIQNESVWYDIGSTATVQLTVIRPDKVGVAVTGQPYPIEYAHGDGQIDPETGEEGEVTDTYYGVYAELDQPALAVSGTLLGQFKITTGTQILRTEIFYINNGRALDAEASEWAGEYEGHTLDEMATSIETNTADIATLEADVSQIKEDFTDMVNSAYVTDSANGAVAHFTDGADDIPMKSVKVNIAPVQSGSGDPSPSNVRAISGWSSVKVTRAGKNVFPSKGLTQTLNGITIHSNDDGSFTVNGTATANAQFDLTLNNELKLQSGQYTVGMFADKAVTFDNQHVWWFFYSVDARADIVNCQTPSKTFTLNAVTATRFFLRIISGATCDNVTLYPILVHGSDAPTEFEPYNGNAYDISLSSAGTVYGGTLDVVSGVLTVDKGFVTLDGTQTIANRNWRATSNSVGWLYPYSVTQNVVPNSSTEVPDVISNRVKTASYSAAYNGTENNCVSLVYDTSKAYGLAVRYDNTLLTTDAAINAFLAENPIQVVYSLAAPLTYQLTAQEITSLLGINNVWSDAGDMDVEYRADTKLYIERLTGPDTDMIADANIVSGQYFMVGNNLYKATANIASGASVIVGTNATRKSLSEALNEINA